jgi:transcriptional regulator of acetoin/glycerol metabolism
VILCNGGLVASQHLPAVVASSSRGPIQPAAPGRDEPAAPPLADGLNLDTIQRALLEKALASARNNKSKAAKLLGVPRGRFYSLLRRHGLTGARR